MIQVNLLPQSVLDARRAARLRRNTKIVFVFYLAVLGGLVVLSVLYQQIRSLRLNSARENHATVNARVNKPESVAFRQEALAVQKALTIFSSKTVDPRSTERLLEDLEEVTPGSVTIDSLAHGLEGEIVIEGRARDYPSISEYVKKIESTVIETEKGDSKVSRKPFGSVVIIGVTLADNDTVSFSIRTTYDQFKVSGSEQKDSR